MDIDNYFLKIHAIERLVIKVLLWQHFFLLKGISILKYLKSNLSTINFKIGTLREKKVAS